MARKDNRKVWFVDFPTYQYKEDVIGLARQNNLKIINSKFKKDFRVEDVAESVPKLTKKSAKQLETEM